MKPDNGGARQQPISAAPRSSQRLARPDSGFGSAFHVCLHSCRHAWKRCWQRFRSAAGEPPRAYL
eukprot:7075310-Pyramimonas_sp.AAC.1